MRFAPAIHCSISMRCSGSETVRSSSSRWERIPNKGLLISWAAPRANRAKAAYFSYSANWRLELSFFLVEFPFLIEPAKKLFLREIALMGELLQQIGLSFQLLRNVSDLMVAQVPDDESGCHDHRCKREQVGDCDVMRRCKQLSNQRFRGHYQIAARVGRGELHATSTMRLFVSRGCDWGHRGTCGGYAKCEKIGPSRGGPFFCSGTCYCWDMGAMSVMCRVLVD